MRRLVVHIAEPKDFSPEVVLRLKKFAFVKMLEIDQGQVKQSLEQCDVFWFRLGFRINSEVLSKSIKCKYILCPVTGLDHIDLDTCRDLGIQVISLRGEYEFLKTVRATAEHTLGLAIALSRHIVDAALHVRQGEWNRDIFKGKEIFEKKVGVLGMGRLGTIVASYFKALGAEVRGYDIREGDHSVCDHTTSPEELFEWSDVVTVHLSYNSSTHHFVNKELFQHLHNGAIIINTARGAIVKSEDLLWALENKVIAGAALDVLENEFALENNLLIAYARHNSNLLITPHIGGNTVESFTKTETFLCEKLEHLLGVS